MSMSKKSTKIMNDLIKSVKEDFVGFRIGQIYEVLKPIYPGVNIKKHDKIITYMDLTFTKPLALNKKNKMNLKKEGSSLVDFFKELNFGDFLLVNKVENRIAQCVNLSLNDNIKERFYSGEKDYIFLKEIDIINGIVKLFKSKKLPYKEIYAWN